MTLREQMAGLKADMQAIVDRAKAESRDLTDDEATEIETKGDEHADLKGRVERSEKAAKRLADLADAGDVPAGETHEDAKSAPVPAGLGEAFAKSTAYKSFRSEHPSGVGRGTPVHIGAKLGPMSSLFKATIGLDSQATSFPRPQIFPTLDTTNPEDTSLVDLVTRGSMSGNMIEYLQIMSVTPGAAIVAPGELKPLSDMATNQADAKAYTYADGFTVTNQSLADDAFISSYLQARLPRHLREEVQRVLLAGTGTNGEPAGILNTTGVQAQAYDGTVLDTIAGALEKVENAYGTPTAIALSVADAWELMKLKDANQRYYSQGPWSTGPGTVWGVPFVKVRGLAAGQAIVGDFRTVALLDREGVSVVAFNQHEDYARRNLTYVRGELRAAQAIFEPSKLVITDLTAA